MKKHMPKSEMNSKFFNEINKNEEVLRDNENRNRTIFENAEEGIVYANPDGIYLYCNKRFADMLGYAEFEIPGKTSTDLCFASEQTLIQEIRRTLNHGDVFHGELRFRRNDGSELWARMNGSPIFNAAGKHIANFAMLTDITERKQFEKRLIESDKRQKFLLKLSDALRKLAHPYEIKNAAARILGDYLGANQVHYIETASDMVIVNKGYGRGLPPMVGRFHYKDFGERLISIYSAGSTVVCNNVASDPTKTEDEVKLITSFGIQAYIGVPLVKDGHWVATLAVQSIEPRTWTMEDVSLVEEVADRTWTDVERARIEDALFKAERDKNEALKKSIEMKDEFLSLISHEFKTPLTVINSAIQAMRLICKNELSDKANEFLSKILQNSNRQLKLVNNLLDITRINVSRMKIHKTNVDIVELTKIIMESITVFAFQKEMNFSFSSTLKKKVIAIDEEKYERILLNLLSNAIKFTQRGKLISVRVSLKIINGKSKVCIQVKDQGIGIPPEKQQLIFERFGQVDSSLSRQAEGTGIGLSLVKMFVENMGGEIGVESEVGKGSIFTVLLPVARIKDTRNENMLHIINDNRLIQASAIEFSDIY